MYYSELATIVETLPIVPNKFSITTTKDYYADMYFLVKKTTLSYSTYPNLPKILSCLIKDKAKGMDFIPTKFLKETANVLVSLLHSLKL